MNRHITPFLFTFIAVLLIYALFQTASMRMQGKTTKVPREKIVRGIVVCYAVALAVQLVIPDLWDTRFEMGSYNVVPGRTIAQFLGGDIPVNDSDVTGAVVDNLLLNLLSFIPVGLLPLVSKKVNTFSRVIVCSVAVNILIEGAQYVTGAVADIDDVILRMAGVLIGLGIFKLFCGKQAKQN